MNMKKKDVAADTVIIDAETMKRGNYDSVSDALKDSGVNVAQTSGASYPIINGDKRVLVLVNGRNVGWNHLTVSGGDNVALDIDSIPVDNIERIEIVRGPNSSLYGNKAMGGVVNIITKAPKEGQTTTVKTEYGTWNHRKGYIMTEGGDEDTRYMLSVSKEKRDNYKYKTASGSKQEYQGTSIDGWDANFRLDKNINDDSLTFEFANHEDKNGIGMYLKDPEAGIAYSGDQRRDRTKRSFALTYNFGGASGNLNDFIKVYNNKQKDEYTFAGAPYAEDLELWGVDLQKGWNTSDNNTLLAGIGYTDEHIKENNNGIIDASTTTGSVFLEDHWKMKDGWSLNVGSRLEHHDDFGSDVTSHVSVNKAVSPITNVYLSWGQAVNNPTLKMLYADTPFMKGTPNLKQEKAQTVTLGFNSQITPNTLFEGSLYTSKVNDALVWKYTDYTRYYNINEEKRQGLELTLSHVLSPQWKARVGYSYSKVEQDKSNAGFESDYTNSRPNGYLLGLSYTQGKLDGDLTLERVTGLYDNLYTGKNYTTLDLGFNYHFTDDTKMYLKGYNLTDEGYETYAYEYWNVKGAYAAPGRSIVVGFEQSF